MYYYDKTSSFDPIEAPLYSPRSLDITFQGVRYISENIDNLKSILSSLNFLGFPRYILQSILQVFCNILTNATIRRILV